MKPKNQTKDSLEPGLLVSFALVESGREPSLMDADSILLLSRPSKHKKKMKMVMAEVRSCPQRWEEVPLELFIIVFSNGHGTVVQM